MSLDDYFAKISDNMPNRTTKKSTKTTTPVDVHEELANVSEANTIADPGTMDLIIQKMTDIITKVIDAKIRTVLEAIAGHSAEIQSVVKRVVEAEGRIAAVETSTTSMDAKIKALEKQVREMAEHIDDLDNRGRRCNIRVVGLPENSEGTRSVKFFEEWIPGYLQMDTKAGRVKLDRAHRSQAPIPGPNQCPRPVVIKFHNFTDKQRVMDAARNIGSDGSQHKGPKVSFFNDYSTAVVGRRKAFDEAKARLRRMKMDYALLYPATLKIMVNGSPKKLYTPEEAAAFIDSLGLLDITQLKSKLRESLKRMLLATVQLLKSRAMSLYSNIETMCNAEVAGIETRRSALNRLGQRQEYVADFAEKALNVEDFFALLSCKGQIGSQLQHLLTQSTEPPGTMLKLQLVITDDFKKQIASFGKLLGDIVPFAQSHVSQDNPLENQERPNAPSGQTSSSAPNMSIHSVPPNPVFQPPHPSYTAPSNPHSQPSTSQPSTSRAPPPYRSLPVHTPSNLPLSHPVTPQPCPSTLAPSHLSLNIHNSPFCLPSNPAQPSLVPALHVQSALVPTNHAQLSPVQPPTSPSLQPLIEATPRLYGMFKATPPPGPGRSRRGKDGKSWTFHSYSPVEICLPPSGSSSPAAIAQHQIRNFPESQLLWILHQPPSVNPIPVLPVKALADSPCDRSLPPTGLADPDLNSQARENEPTSTVTELETDTEADSAIELEVPSAWGDRKAAACSDTTSSDLPFTGTLSAERTSNHLSHSVLTHTHHPKEETDMDPNSKPYTVGRTRTAPHNNKKMAYDQQHEDSKAIRSLHRHVNNWRTELPTRIRLLLEGPSPSPNRTGLVEGPSLNPTRTGLVVATEMPTRQPNNTEPPSLTNGNNVNNSRYWQPRVLMFRLPISTPTPGGALPQFLLVQGASKDEIILQEIAEDHQSHGDDITPPESDNLLWTKALSSPESPPLLQYVTCAACHTVGGSLFCVECGRGYHQDCHIPPIGPSFWEEWKCSLCQDLADTTDPYSDDRHRTMCLSLADQRKCEHLLLFLRCENDRNILCSTAEPPSDSICLDSIHGRLLQHRSPPYRTPSEFVSDVWVLFDTMLMNSKDQELVVTLRGSFQRKLGEVFGTALHPSLLRHPNSSWTETGEPEEPTAAESLKRMRELLNMTKVPKSKKHHSQVRVETDENETNVKKIKKDAD